MAVLYNLEPLAAISLFYDGEKNGVWEGDFIKNEKKRGLCLPPLLREYLENYAYLEINRGQIVFFHPDQIREFNIPIDNGDVHIMTIGRAENFFVGIELDTDELDISIGEIDEENRSIMWGPAE